MRGLPSRWGGGYDQLIARDGRHELCPILSRIGESSRSLLPFATSGPVSHRRDVCAALVCFMVFLGHPVDSSADDSWNKVPPLAGLPAQSTESEESNAADMIELTEQMSVQIPEGRLLRGAALSPSGEVIAAWFDAVRGIRIYDGAIARDLLTRALGQAIGVAFLDETRLEVVDAVGGDVVIADTAGNILSRRSLSGAGEAGSAARAASGWFLTVSDSASARVQLPGGRGAWSPDSTYTATLAVSAAGHDAIVWQSFGSFRAWRIGSGTDWVPVEFQQITANWFDDGIASSLRLDPGIWSTTSVVVIGSAGYVQTVAHRGTDQRLLLWFDSRGRFRTHTTLEAPFGFVASAAEASTVIAVRTLNASELVTYSWESVQDSTRGKGERR